MHVSADALLDALRSQGLRITKARRIVCEVLAESHDDHLTAAAIYEAVRADSGVRLDRSTVYRTLETLEATGLLTHGHLGHGPSVYHLAGHRPHQHIVCERCGATASLSTGSFARLTDDLERTTGFRLDPAHFALTGLCPDCAASAESST